MPVLLQVRQVLQFRGEVPIHPRQEQGGCVPGVPERQVREEGQLSPDARDSVGKNAGLRPLREGSVLHAQLPVSARESQPQRGSLPQFLEGLFLFIFCRLLLVFFVLRVRAFLGHSLDNSQRGSRSEVVLFY